jgi:hypothetical protein
MTFLTADGYRLWWNAAMNEWQDSPDPAKVDLSFDPGRDGLPITSTGDAVDGELVQ